MQKNNIDFEKAKLGAFRLLMYRLRSCDEIRQKLKQKKFLPQTIEKLIVFLKEKKFLNDVEFAKSWIKYRKENNFGNKKIIYELLMKGIDKQTINRLLNEVDSKYKDDRLIQELTKNKFERILKSCRDPIKAKRRLYGYLSRRGYYSQDIQQVISQL